MRRRTRPFNFQMLLLRIAAVSLPVILILSLLAPTAFAKAGDTSGEAGEHRTARSVTIEYHGQTTKTTSFAGTVGELLSQLGLALSGEDVASHGMDEPIADGMVLRIDRVVTRREVYTTAVPHDVSYCSDPTIPQGTEEVLVKGVNGELSCTADVTYINGVEIRRQLLSQDVTRPAVTEIIGQGAGKTAEQADPEGMPVIGDGYIMLPTGEVLTYTHTASVRASAYTHTDAGCDSYTATGSIVHHGVVAVNPRYIPYGTRMFIISDDGAYIYGISVAEDFGGSIGADRLDLYFPTYSECMQFGRRDCTVYFLS